MFVRVSLLACVMFVMTGLASLASAAIIPIGSGENTAYVVVNFADGADYRFDVSFTGSVTGLDLFDLIEASTTLTTDRQTFDFGAGPVVFIDGIHFDGHDNSGFGGGENYWHYFTRDAAIDPWAVSFDAVNQRVAGDDSWDGWVYGSASEPFVTSIPEPASMISFALVMGALVTRRR